MTQQWVKGLAERWTRWGGEGAREMKKVVPWFWEKYVEETM